MSSPGQDLPLIMTTEGPQPTPPATIRSELIANVAATNPGYTANLPGSLIEDISSTDVAAIVLCDSARVDTINSISPFGANAFVLNALGQMLGVTLGTTTNTSVFVVFTGPVGLVIPIGFTVSDGTYQYTIQDGGIIASGGSSSPLFCLAVQSGSWVIPAGSVTQIVTSVPSTISLTVTNPEAGIPGAGAETEEDYRARVFQANLAASQGMSRYLKTLLGNVSGVQSRLISAIQETDGWEIIVGGGDPYEVAYAIWTALFDVSNLVGSTIEITAITKADPGVVTTNLNHGLISGQANVNIADVVGMTEANGGPYTVTVITEKTFSFGVDTTSFTTYISGGVVTPNSRNISVSISDPPDTYVIPFVIPPQQSVTIAVTWNTTSNNFVSNAAVAQLGGPALVNYVNSLAVGMPINLFELQTTFQNAISSILTPQLLTRMVFAVDINGVSVSPSSGTGIIAGDPESYFLTSVANVTFSQA